MIGSKTTALAVLGVLGICVAPTIAAAAAEERCNALGPACVCSEPLNANQDVETMIHTDPVDSVGAKQCLGETGDGRAVYFKNGSHAVRPTGEAALPPGHTVDWVWAKTGKGIAHVEGIDQTWRHGTMCMRSYQRWSQNYQNPGPGDRVKIIAFGDTSTSHVLVVNFEWNPATTPNKLRGALTYAGWGADKAVYMNDFQFQDCKDAWCRFEICLDHRDDDTIVARHRISQVGSTKQRTVTNVVENKIPEITIGRPWIADAFTQFPDGLPMSNIRYLSHQMQALTYPADSNFWIGPAQEIEGNMGDVPPYIEPPPQPDPEPEPEPEPTPDPAPNPLGAPGRPYLVR